jgi:SAM-dependent methyltransferase
MKCLVCAKADSRYWFRKNDFDIFRCQRCLSAWVAPTPDAEYLKNFYRSAAGFETKDDAHSVSVTRQTAVRRRKAIGQFRGAGRVLDVGSGRGFFLAEMCEHGYEGVGIELNPEDAEAARGRAGVSIIEQPFLEAGLAPNSFDVVNLDQCLEHLAEPETVLRHAKQLLTPGGVLALAVPNHASLQSRALGTGDPYITPPEHLFYYTLAGLREMLDRVGFRLLRVKTCGELQGSSILHGLSRLTPGPLGRAFSGMPPQAESIVTLLAKPVTAALNVMGRGAVVEFLAVKD